MEYVLYLRKSRGRAGISRQRVTTTAYIEEQGGTILAEFADTDRTAFRKVGEDRPERTGFDAMIALLRTRPGLGVAAWHADRLTRNPEDTELLLAVCVAGGSPVETRSGGSYNVANANGRKRLLQDALDARYEVDHMTERITAAKAEARGNGWWLGGPRPFGWERDPGAREGEGPKLRPRAAEAALIRDGTAAILTGGVPLAAVVRTWNASGITTSRGRPWTPTEISRVLRRARNAGIAEHGGKEAGPAAWPAIVSEEDWRTCKAILEDAGRRSTPGPRPRWLLSGIAICGVCGTPLIVNPVAGKGRPPRPVYRDRPRAGRGHVGRDARSLDAYITELAIGYVERHGRGFLVPKGPDMGALTAQRAALEAELGGLTAAAEREEIQSWQMIRASKPVNEKIRYIDGLLATAASMASPSLMFTDDDIRACWHRAGLEAQRALIRVLMTVTILPSPRGRPAGHKPGEPYFRPEYVKVEWKRKGASPSA